MGVCDVDTKEGFILIRRRSQLMGVFHGHAEEE